MSVLKVKRVQQEGRRGCRSSTDDPGTLQNNSSKWCQHLNKLPGNSRFRAGPLPLPSPQKGLWFATQVNLAGKCTALLHCTAQEAKLLLHILKKEEWICPRSYNIQIRELCRSGAGQHNGIIIDLIGWKQRSQPFHSVLKKQYKMKTRANPAMQTLQFNTAWNYFQICGASQIQVNYSIW